MSALAVQSFDFGAKLVRAFDRDGQAWFVANDVCAALDIENASRATSRLEADEKGVHTMNTPGGRQQVTIISESGVYALIFTSRKPAAKQFRRWVTQEVLPALRETGRYQMVAAASDFALPAALGANAVDPLEDVAGESAVDLLRTKLAVVREARRMYGLKVARIAWEQLGILPGLADAAERAAVLPSHLVSPLFKSVATWVEERCEVVPGYRVRAMDLYYAYLDWAKATDLSQDEIVSLTGFGRALTTIGVGHLRSGNVYRVGIRPCEA